MRKTAVPAVLLLLAILGCASKPPAESAARTEGSAGVRALVEQGTPSSLVEALEQARNVPEAERGFVQAAAALLANIYPDVPVPAAPSEAPSVYARILRDAERGIYIKPASSSRDFFEYVLPFLAFFHGSKTAIQNSLADLDKAAALNPQSALPPLLRGIACERSGDAAAAGEAFTRALALGADYQAELGLARLQHSRGDYDAELERLLRLRNREPESTSGKRQLGRVSAQRGDNALADALTAEVLARNPRDGEFLLLRARVLIDQGLFNQALSPLEAYAAIDSGGRQYLFLRARVQAEGYRNRAAALGYLRTLLRADAGDEEAAVYLIALLLESNKAEENAEGRSLLSRFLNRASIPQSILALAVTDSVRRESWREAKTYLDRLLVQSRSAANLLNAYKVERGLGNNAQALLYARELY
ncbi:MAG: hypothetical protein LBN92_06750, partial [Treponema sp.]|nr:hypothetical protein [Treponema sp.]